MRTQNYIVNAFPVLKYSVQEVHLKCVHCSLTNHPNFDVLSSRAGSQATKGCERTVPTRERSKGIPDGPTETCLVWIVGHGVLIWFHVTHVTTCYNSLWWLNSGRGRVLKSHCTCSGRCGLWCKTLHHQIDEEIRHGLQPAGGELGLRCPGSSCRSQGGRGRQLIQHRYKAKKHGNNCPEKQVTIDRHLADILPQHFQQLQLQSGANFFSMHTNLQGVTHLTGPNSDHKLIRSQDRWEVRVSQVHGHHVFCTCIVRITYIIMYRYMYAKYF